MSGFLELIDIQKSYGRRKALNGFSASLAESRITGLLGPNGAGKTTLLNIVAGLLDPDTGKVMFNGEMRNHSSKELIAYMPHRFFPPRYFKGTDAVRYYSDFYRDFDRTRFQELSGLLNIDTQRPIHRLSAGEARKLQLALTLARNAPLILMDEPFTDLDLQTRDAVCLALSSWIPNGSTVLLCTHLVEEAEPFLDDVIFINQGKCIETIDVEKKREENGQSVADLYRRIIQ